MLQLSFPSADLLYYRALIFRGDLYSQKFKRFILYTGLFVVDNFGLGDLKLKSLAAHLFDKDSQMKLAAPGDKKGIRAFGLVDAERDVSFGLLKKTVADIARSDIFAFPAGERAGIDTECHLDRRLIYVRRSKRRRIVRVCYC